MDQKWDEMTSFGNVKSENRLKFSLVSSIIHRGGGGMRSTRKTGQ